ncbi:hypothetical protein PAMP_017759 [Pampus punctatissimus]
MGCSDKWDREPKRRAMQNGIRAKDRMIFPTGVETKHTFLERTEILEPCGAARERPSVSCVCSGAGEGLPAPPKESSDPKKWKKGGVLCGKAKARSGEKRAATKQLSSRERESQRVTGWGERQRRGGCWNNAPSAAEESPSLKTVGLKAIPPCLHLLYILMMIHVCC